MSELAIGAIVALVVVGLAIAFVVSKTAKLNSDPLQHELAELLAEVLAKGFSDNAVEIFCVSSMNRFARRMILEEGERQTRFAHALSLLRPSLSPEGYQALRLFLRDQ